MKLLEKTDIAKAKVLERQVEIQEGAKLAKKVDSLRQMKADEQANLLKFRDETIRKVRAEIDKYIREREILGEEVRSLDLKRTKLLEPLDNEWEKVNAKKDELLAYAKQLNEEHLTLKSLAKDMEVDKAHLSEETQRIEEERRSSIKSLAEAESTKETARKTLIEAQAIKEKTIQELEIKEQELDMKEASVKASQIDIKNKYADLEKENKFIRAEKIRLADQRKTLERAMDRLKK
jgi:hypothetical protein